MRLSPGCGSFRRRPLSGSPWPAVAAAPAAGRRPLPGAGRSPARLAPPAVGAAPRFSQGSSRAPCGRPCAPLRCFAPSGRPFPCPGGAPLAAERPRSLCLGRRPGCGWGGGGSPLPASLRSVRPLRSPRGAMSPALAGGLFVALCAPRGKRGFLSPLRRRHGGFLIPLYAAQQVEAPCVADTVIKDRSDYASPHGHFKQNMIYFV